MSSVYPDFAQMIPMPDYMLFSQRVGSDAKITYLYLLHNVWSGNGLVPRPHDIAHATGISLAGVKRAFEELVAATYITYDGRHLTILHDPDAKPPMQYPGPRKRPRSTKPPKLSRHFQMVRDYNATCAYCKQQGTDAAGPDGHPWHGDHVWAKAQGGEDSAKNIVLACRTCNLRKQQLSAEGFLAKLADTTSAGRHGG